MVSGRTIGFLDPTYRGAVMAVAAVGDHFLISMNLLWGGQKLINTFKYRLETVPGGTTTDTICTEMNTLIILGGQLFQKYLATLPPAVLVVSRDFQRTFPVRIRKVTFASGLNGTWTGAGTAINSAVSIERFAEVASRKGVGRVQLPASNAPADITLGTVTNAAYLVVLNALAAQMPGMLTLAPSGATMKPILTTLATPGTFNYVIGALTQATLRTMRRRTVGVGK